jgi:hypothetical protein
MVSPEAVEESEEEGGGDEDQHRIPVIVSEASNEPAAYTMNTKVRWHDEY